MEMAFLVATVLLLTFAVLGLYDGFYLHIFKYRLHDHPESKGEHLTHTMRAILFPLMLYFLYLRNDDVSFYIGMAVVILDIIITIIDAYMEKDSRAFMGGLPRGEYIIHLLVNGFHFAAIAVYLLIRVNVTESGFVLNQRFDEVSSYHTFTWLVRNLLPGAFLMGVIHVVVAIPVLAKHWNYYREKIACC